MPGTDLKRIRRKARLEVGASPSLLHIRPYLSSGGTPSPDLPSLSDGGVVKSRELDTWCLGPNVTQLEGQAGFCL